MDSQTYYVDKTSDTSADILLVVGLAVLLDTLLPSNEKSQDVLIENVDSHYQIHIPFPIHTNDIERLERIPPLVRPLISEKQIIKQAKLGWSIETFGFPYDEQLLQSKQYYEGRKFLRADQKRPEAIWQKTKSPELEHVERLRPKPEFMHYQTISQMKVVDTFNEVTRRWYTLTIEQMRSLLSILLTLFSNPMNDVAQAAMKWQKLIKDSRGRGDAEITVLQVINPTTGKGANRTRAGELSIGNLSNFWPLELLKFTGFMYAAVPFTVRESKDRKIYVLQPNKIELGKLKGIMNNFRKVCWSSTAIKLDIMVSLRFAQTFVEHRRRFLASEEEGEDLFSEKELFSVAQGFNTTSYKDLGSAYATMNTASINLPGWIPPVDTLACAERVSGLLTEHIRIIQGIQDSKGKEGSEEYELLRFYRDFLSGHDLRPFWKFTTAYSSYLIGQHEREKNLKRQTRQLSYEGLETILMNTNNGIKLTDITRKPGFKRIAYAIRHSTVIPQHLRAQKDDRTYEIRYGLGQELMRKARYRNEFMVALSEFLHLYNAENARVEEKIGRGSEKKPKKLRSNVSYTDIDEIADLIDTFNSSELICSMLVACGYASDYSKSASQETTEPSGEEFDDVSSDEEAE